MKWMRDVLEMTAWHFNDWAKKIYQSPQDKLCKEWFTIQGDQTLRLDYPLNSESVVLDLGGFEGAWAADIFCRYNCSLFIFEPVSAYATRIRTRFKNNPKIKIFEFGLSSSNRNEIIHLNQDRSSTFSETNKNGQNIQIKNASEFLKQQELKSIDLCKMNIEGGEFELLEHLLENDWINRIKNIQIQFHNFVPDATQRMQKIQEQLKKTHTLTYQYPWVWENWKLKA